MGLEMETFLHKDELLVNGKAGDYTVIPLDEIPEKDSSHWSSETDPLANLRLWDSSQNHKTVLEANGFDPRNKTVGAVEQKFSVDFHISEPSVNHNHDPAFPADFQELL